MYQNDTEGFAVKKTVLISAVAAVLFTFATTLALFYNSYLGFVVVEGLEAIGFALAAFSLLMYAPFLCLLGPIN